MQDVGRRTGAQDAGRRTQLRVPSPGCRNCGPGRRRDNEGQRASGKSLSDMGEAAAPPPRLVEASGPEVGGPRTDVPSYLEIPKATEAVT